MIDQKDTPFLKGIIRVINAETGKETYRADNVIVMGTKFLFSRLFATLGNSEIELPKWGVWGLAIGSGDPSWSPTKEYDAPVTQWELHKEILRKQISKAQFVKREYSIDRSTYDIVPTGGINEGMVEFQTPLNATTDSKLLVSGEVQTIRELGLIGGGVKETDPMTAKMWNKETNNVGNSMTLINYKTLLPLILPKDVTFLISWTLAFDTPPVPNIGW